MKKFISKIQNLSQRAAELQQAIRSAPPKLASLREAVAVTTDQLRQLRSDVEQGLTDLKADNEVQLIDSLREINSSVEILRQAGYELGGVEMELSPTQRLIVHLSRMRDVPLSALRSLVSSNEHRRITQAVLKSLIQAEEMADQVDLTDLVYHKLIVNVGPIPSVRLCWRSEDEEVAPEETPLARPAASTGSPPASSLATYGRGSFFEPRTESTGQPGPAQPSATAPAVAPVSTGSAHSSPPARGAATSPKHTVKTSTRPLTGGKDWGRESLERFKKMPSTSKYRR